MLNLNSNININIIINYKLKTLGITKLGHLVSTSYAELYLSKRFTDSELKEITQYLFYLNTNFFDNLSKPQKYWLGNKLLEFNFEEYQKQLCYAHLKVYDKHNLEHLKYSDPLEVVLPLFFLYRELHLEEKENFLSDTKILLNNFINNHKYITIADFVDIKPSYIDTYTLKVISKLLGLPFNYELSDEEYFERENSIFTGEDVNNETIQSYESLVNEYNKASKKLIKKIDENHKL